MSPQKFAANASQSAPQIDNRSQAFSFDPGKAFANPANGILPSGMRNYKAPISHTANPISTAINRPPKSQSSNSWPKTSTANTISVPQLAQSGEHSKASIDESEPLVIQQQAKESDRHKTFSHDVKSQQYSQNSGYQQNAVSQILSQTSNSGHPVSGDRDKTSQVQQSVLSQEVQRDDDSQCVDFVSGPPAKRLKASKSCSAVQAKCASWHEKEETAQFGTSTDHDLPRNQNDQTHRNSNTGTHVPQILSKTQSCPQSDKNSWRTQPHASHFTFDSRLMDIQANRAIELQRPVIPDANGIWTLENRAPTTRQNELEGNSIHSNLDPSRHAHVPKHNSGIVQVSNVRQSEKEIRHESKGLNRNSAPASLSRSEQIQTSESVHLNGQASSNSAAPKAPSYAMLEQSQGASIQQLWGKIDRYRKLAHTLPPPPCSYAK